MMSMQLDDQVADDDFQLDGFVPYLLNRITNRLNKNLTDALRAVDLTVPQWRVLGVLHAGRGGSLNEISTYAVIDQSTLSRTIDRMEEAGLVGRRRRVSDGRVVGVLLTEKGQDLFARIWPIAEEQYLNAMQGIDEEEARAFVRTLRRILENVRETPFA